MTDRQLSLLTDPTATAPYRRSSPSSRDGAAAVEPHVAGLQKAALRLYRDAGERGLTDEELAEALDIKRTTAIPRRHELAAKGLVSAKPVGRRMGSAGVRVGVYVASEHKRETRERRSA